MKFGGWRGVEGAASNVDRSQIEGGRRWKGRIDVPIATEYGVNRP
jgi:hypothetical protein